MLEQKLLLFLLMSQFLCCGQQINFNAYSNISDSQFKDFVDLFPNMDLPVDTQILRDSASFLQLGITNLPKESIDEYLKVNNEFIMPSLYNYQVESGERTDRFGSFQPVFRLPTNGDYVLLVIYQYDVRYETSNRVIILSYDLQGNFIKSIGSGFLLDGTSSYLNCSLNENLEFYFTNINDVADDVNAQWACRPCKSTYSTSKWEILPNGQDSLVNTTDHGSASFHYNGYYFVKQ